MLSKIKKYLSYVYPIVEKKTRGEHHSLLEVSWANGVLTLNTQNANYSFGSLHKIFVEAFKYFKFQPQPNDSMLILGFGAGSVFQILRKNYKFKGKITGIEFDQKVIDLGREYFYIPESNANFELIHSEVISYLKKESKIFNIVIIDLFIDLEVPMQFFEKPFLELLKNKIPTNGQVFFNLVDASQNQAALTNARKIINEIGMQSNLFCIKIYDTTNYVLKISF